MKKFFFISSLLFACATTTPHVSTDKVPPAPTSPPVAQDDERYAQPPAEKGALPSADMGNPPTHAAAKKSRASAPEMNDLAEPAPSGSGAGAPATAQAELADSAAPPQRASKSMAPPSAAGAMASRPPPMLDRPGLATAWGETRYSPVNEVQFERDSGRPNCQGSLWYNDRNGAEAAGRSAAWNQARLPIGCGVSLELRDDNGNTLTAVRSGNRLYAIGETHQRYTITVHNNSNERYEMVVSVDGLDVINGKAAGFAQRGYLVPAHGTVDIEGFRRSGAEVAAFRFGSVGDSYAAQSTGNVRNVGVIGLAAFAERGSIPNYSYRELEQRRNADPFPNRYAPPPPPIANNIVY